MSCDSAFIFLRRRPFGARHTSGIPPQLQSIIALSCSFVKMEAFLAIFSTFCTNSKGSNLIICHIFQYYTAISYQKAKKP